MKKIGMCCFLAVLAASMLSACGDYETGSTNESSTESTLSVAKELTSAELITDENRHLIGTEIISTYTPEVSEQENAIGSDENNIQIFPWNDVVSAAADDVTVPSTISVFAATENVTPEVIIPNGSCAVFVPAEGTRGWSCEKGEILQFSFEKYESEVSKEQTMVIGVVDNGTMIAGKAETDSQGAYTYTVNEEGEYAIYIISATSDYLSLKTGQINLIEAATTE